MNLPEFPADKIQHAAYGAIIGTAAAFASLVLGHPEWSRIACVASAAAAGITKEVLDWFANRRIVASGGLPTHDVDALDFLATLLGGALVAVRP